MMFNDVLDVPMIYILTTPSTTTQCQYLEGVLYTI